MIAYVVAGFQQDEHENMQVQFLTVPLSSIELAQQHICEISEGKKDCTYHILMANIRLMPLKSAIGSSSPEFAKFFVLKMTDEAKENYTNYLKSHLRAQPAMNPLREDAIALLCTPQAN